MAAGKPSFAEIVSESFGFFFANTRLFFDIVTIPWIMSLAIRLVGSTLPRDSLLPVLIEKGVDVLPTVIFMVAWQRVVLLGPRGLGRLPGTAWTSRETSFLLHLIKVGGIPFVLLAAFVLTIGDVDPELIGSVPAPDSEEARRQALAAPIGAGFTVSVLIALRLSYGLAATSVDVPFAPRDSWRYSRGSAWSVVGSLFLIFLLGAFATTLATLLTLAIMRGVLGAGAAAAVVTWTVGLLVSYAGAAVAATAQAIIFRRLVDWRPGATLPSPTENGGR